MGVIFRQRWLNTTPTSMAITPGQRERHADNTYQEHRIDVDGNKLGLVSTLRTGAAND